MWLNELFITYYFPLFSGKEFVRFFGTTCEKKDQYGNFSSLKDAKKACALDQNCIAFHAIKPGCEKWRRVNNNPPIEPKDDDFKLCKRNSSLKHEIRDIMQYNNDN